MPDINESFISGEIDLEDLTSGGDGIVYAESPTEAACIRQNLLRNGIAPYGVDRDSSLPIFVMTQRERDTVIASLRLWQAMRGKIADVLGAAQANHLEIVAENDRDGDDAALLDSEIDDLIEDRINA